MPVRTFPAIACALTAAALALPAAASTLPVQAQLHVNLVPDGDFTVPSPAWDLGSCARDEARGAPAPSVRCGAGLDASGGVQCDPSRCWSDAFAWAETVSSRSVTLLPVYAGQAAPGYQVHSYVIALDYRLKLAGSVDGDSENRWGNANLNLQVGFREPGSPWTFAQFGLGGIGAGTGCCPPTYAFEQDSGWQSHPGLPVHEQIAGYAGQTLEMVVRTDCNGNAHQDNSPNPVALHVSCEALVDNVALKAVFATP